MEIGKTIKVNGHDFTVQRIEDQGTEFEALTGRYEHGPSFARDNRTIFVCYLEKLKSSNQYRYDFNAN